MKELLKAQKLYQEIIKYDEDIIKLESNLDAIIKDNLDGSIDLFINTKKEEKLKLDEDGSIVTREEATPYTFSFRMGAITSNEDDKREKFSSKLGESEIVLMFATLLRYKQDQRRSLIKQFNSLGLKLKI